MDRTLEVIKLDLLSEYEQLGRVDIAEWVNRHREHRDELLDFWMWLSVAQEDDASIQDSLSPLDVSERQTYEASIRDACMAVTLGSQWLLPSLDQDAGELEALGIELEALRSKSLSQKKTSLAFRKAVVCTWVVDRLQETRPRVTRLATQKVAYLLEHAMCLGLFVEHDRKRLGPYDRNMKYKDAEPIARKKGWLEVTGTVLRASNDLSELNRFLPNYVRSEHLAARLVETLARFSDDRLETLATVHAITTVLNSQNQAATVENVLRALADIEEWKPKLSRSNFSNDSVRDALLFLVRVRLVQRAIPLK